MKKKYLTKPIAATIIAILLSATHQDAHSSEQAPLQAGIEHAEQLPAVKLSSMAGQKFDSKSALCIEDKEWFVIPTWFAGTWRTIQQARVSRYDNRSGEMQTQETILPTREREVFGYQTDRQQNPWTLQRPLQPIILSSTMPNLESNKPSDTIPVTIYTFRQNQPVSEDSSKVVMKTLDTVLTVRNDTNKIESVEQRETYRTFIRIDAELMALYSDEQTYDQQGLPKVRSKIAELRKRDAELKVVDEFKMTNILASFKNFLKGAGQGNIAPER